MTTLRASANSVRDNLVDLVFSCYALLAASVSSAYDIHAAVAKRVVNLVLVLLCSACCWVRRVNGNLGRVLFLFVSAWLRKPFSSLDGMLSKLFSRYRASFLRILRVVAHAPRQFRMSVPMVPDYFT